MRLVGRREFLGLAGATSMGLVVRSAGAANAAGAMVVRAQRSNWVASPFTLGSYSYLGLDADTSDRAAFGQVLAGRVTFAGEHTSSSAPATVHGAWESGRQAAQRINALGSRKVVVIGGGASGLAAA